MSKQTDEQKFVQPSNQSALVSTKLDLWVGKSHSSHFLFKYFHVATFVDISQALRPESVMGLVFWPAVEA